MIFPQLKQNAALGACLLMFVLSASTAQAGNLHWNTDYAAARKQAIAESKPLLAMFTASWCGPCQKMKAGTLSNAAIETEIEKNFIPVMIDTDRNPQLSRQFRITALPTIMTIHPVKETGERIVGYKGGNEFLSYLKAQKSDLQLATTPEQPPQRTMEQAAAQTGDQSLLTPYCLATVVDEGRLESGKSQFSAEHNGINVVFATAQKRDQFLKNPQAYWPQLDGKCPVVMKEEGKEILGEARWAVEYDQQLFFCHSKDHALQFMESPEKYSPEEVKVGLKETENKRVQ